MISSIYILQDNNKQRIGATFKEANADQICNETKGWTNWRVPFFALDETDLKRISAPIPKDFLNNQ